MESWARNSNVNLLFRDECIEGMHTYGYVIVMIYVGLCLLSSIPLILGASESTKVVFIKRTFGWPIPFQLS